MMREGAKLASYRLLADALAGIEDARWEIVIAGDGEGRRDVERSFARFGAGRVRFTGALDRTGVAQLLSTSDLFVWPAIDEAFGMALLEAQALALPVVAGRSDGVSAIVDDGATGLLPRYGDAAAFAAAVRRLIEDEALRRAMARAACAYASDRHDVASAALRLDAFLARVRARRPC
jgi:glycosyltransferase involved in cell wall biosynthesis